MKILWLVNIVLPEAADLLGETRLPLGGWLVNASKILSEQFNIDLVILFPHGTSANLTKLKSERITYYTFKPIKDSNKSIIENPSSFIELLNVEKPDLVHIHGTELPHSLAMANACGVTGCKTVVSIQGMVSVIEKHLFSNLPLKVIFGHTFRTLLLRDNVWGLRKIYRRRAKNEILTIKSTNHIIGRTTWDRACSTQINPNAEYHFCYETLRETFYNEQWDYNKIEKHSLFISQAQYPVKGFHTVLEAAPIILKQFPDLKIYVSGKDFINGSFYKKTYYGNYINELIVKNGLQDRIEFMGMLGEEEMCQAFLKAHVFVSASTIENESNSLSEAKMLGVPSVASFVGGVTDRIRHGEDGFLYQHDAAYMLAHYVSEVFKNNDLALQFSKKSREHAVGIHDKNENIQTLVDIYKTILLDKLV